MSATADACIHTCIYLFLTATGGAAVRLQSLVDPLFDPVLGFGLRQLQQTHGSLGSGHRPPLSAWRMDGTLRDTLDATLISCSCHDNNYAVHVAVSSTYDVELSFMQTRSYM